MNLTALRLSALLLVFARLCLGQLHDPYSFVITGIQDGNMLKAVWKSTPIGFDYYEHDPELRLVGIWSEPTREPPASYNRRLTFLKLLIGKTVHASTITVSYTARNPAKEFYLHLHIEAPTEVLLDDGSSLNEMLLAQGYAMLDEGSASLITPQELERFRASEMMARNSHKGIWSEATDLYTIEKARMLRERDWSSRQRRATGFVAKVQGVFVLIVLCLAYLLRKNRDAAVATLVLLLIPVGLLMPAYVRFGVNPRSNPYAANALLIAITLMAVALLVFLRLVRRGPAEHWGVISIGLKRTPHLFLFFVGLWATIVIFTILYHGLGHLTPALAFHDSISIALGLSAISPVAGTPSALIQKIVLAIWTGFCGATFSPRGSIRSRSIVWNVSVAIGFLLVLAAAVVSVFSLGFSAIFEAHRTADAPDIQQCFMIATITLFRQSFSGVSVDTAQIWKLQIVEANLALFLALVGLRTIYWMVSPSARMTTESSPH